METRWRPWVDALLFHVPHAYKTPESDEIATVQEDGVIWITWSWQSTRQRDGSKWKQVFEALELLAMLARVDQVAWRLLLIRWWPSIANYWEDAPSTQVYRLGCEVRVVEEGILSHLCGRLFQDNIDSVVSEGYTPMRTELEGQCHGYVKYPASIRILVDEDEAYFERRLIQPPEKLSPLLFEVVELAALQHTLDNSPPALPGTFQSLFRLESVHVKALNMRHTPRDLQYFYRIASYGVRVDNLQLNSINLLPENADRYFTMLRELMGVDTRGSAGELEPSSSILVGQEATSLTYDGIFSALLHSQSVRKVTLMTPRLDRRRNRHESPSTVRTPPRDRLWYWIAASIFSSHHPKNRIDSFSFDATKVTMEDAVALEQAIQQPDPLTCLMPSASHRQHAIVTARTFQLRWDEAGDDDSDPASVLTTELPVSCVCLEDGHGKNDQLHVLLPGWGQAWVKISDATVLTEPTDQQPKLRILQNLTVENPDKNYEAVAKVLHVIGSCIRRLEMTSPMTWLRLQATDAWLESILVSCPQLETLSFASPAIPSLDVLVRAYENGSSRMRRVEVHFSSIDDVEASICSFLEHLADRNHVMTRHLRELVIGGIVSPFIPSAILSTILKMLESNDQLSTLTLKLQIVNGMGVSGTESPSTELLMSQLREHNDKQLIVRSRPLTTPRKLAFLSAIWSHGYAFNNRRSSAIHALDASTIGLVFRFAADCCKRQVHIYEDCSLSFI